MNEQVKLTQPPSSTKPPRRARPTSPRLALADAIEIWKRSRLDETIDNIAVTFRVSPARVAEVLSGKRFPEAERLSLI